MLKLLVPHFKLRDIPAMLGLAVLGSLVAGVYGILHDQLTCTVSPEYFTAFKFHQFTYLGSEWPDRLRVAAVGFLATWWVGFFSGWFLGRLSMPHLDRASAFAACRVGFGIIITAAVIAGVLGAAYGEWRLWAGDTDALQKFARSYGVQYAEGFVRVAYIHDGSYLGGLLGLVGACFWLRHRVRTVTQPDLPLGGPGATAHGRTI